MTKNTKFLQRFYTAFNVAFEKVNHQIQTISGIFISQNMDRRSRYPDFRLSLFYLMKTTPSTFVPAEDQGAIFANISLPPSASMERSQFIADQVDSIAHTIPEVNNTLRVVGQNFTAGAGSAYSMVIIKLKAWSERDRSINDVIGELFAKTGGIRDASIFFISPPTLQGFGASGGFEFQLQDKGGHSMDELYKVNTDFLEQLSKRKEIQYAMTSFNPSFPQYLMDINLEKVKNAGFR